MRVLICGSRDGTDRELVLWELRALHAEKGVEAVIHGAACGPDTLAGEAARDLGIPVLPFPADWDRYGRAVGPLRNTRMIREGRPDLVLAFHDHLADSRGTRDVLLQAQVARVPVRLVSHPVAPPCEGDRANSA